MAQRAGRLHLIRGALSRDRIGRYGASSARNKPGGLAVRGRENRNNYYDKKYLHPVRDRKRFILFFR